MSSQRRFCTLNLSDIQNSAPQGSVIGPLLFFLYINTHRNDLIYNLCSCEGNKYNYNCRDIASFSPLADDKSLFVEGSLIDHVIERDGLILSKPV